MHSLNVREISITKFFIPFVSVRSPKSKLCNNFFNIVLQSADVEAINLKMFPPRCSLFFNNP